MKKISSFALLFTLTALACVACVSVTMESPTSQPTNTSLPATTNPDPTQELVNPTPEIFIALTQAIPGEFQPTDAPLAPTATVQPPVSAQTAVTYQRLSFAIPQNVANGALGSDFARQDGEAAAWWQKTPGHLHVTLSDYAHIQAKTHQPAIYVYPASAYAELVPTAFESMHRLNNYLYATNNIPGLDQIPNVPFFNAQLLFASQIQPVSFQNGRGVRFLAEYGQYAAPANNSDLFYNFIGVTADGAYYIVAIFPLTSAILAETPELDSPLPPGGIPYPLEANPNPNLDAYYSAITDLLNAQMPESFTPDLTSLDTLVQSIRIEP